MKNPTMTIFETTSREVQVPKGTVEVSFLQLCKDEELLLITTPERRGSLAHGENVIISVRPNGAIQIYTDAKVNIKPMDEHRG